MLDIGEVRERTGLSAAALRHYEDEGLIQPVGRNGLRRQYADEVVRRLAVLALCKRSGFSLAEIRDLFDRRDSTSWRSQVENKIAHIDQAITELQKMRTSLTHAQECPSDDIMVCAHFNRTVDRVWASCDAESEGPLR